MHVAQVPLAKLLCVGSVWRPARPKEGFAWPVPDASRNREVALRCVGRPFNPGVGP